MPAPRKRRTVNAGKRKVQKSKRPDSRVELILNLEEAKRFLLKELNRLGISDNARKSLTQQLNATTMRLGQLKSGGSILAKPKKKRQLSIQDMVQIRDELKGIREKKNRLMDRNKKNPEKQEQLKKQIELINQALKIVSRGEHPGEIVNKLGVKLSIAG